MVPLRELVHESLESLERLHDRTGLAGLPTGFKDLDELLQGLQKGNLIMVAARPGVGKSSFVTNVARNIAVETNTTVAMFSLEMSQIELGMRLLCSEARVASNRVRGNAIAAEDWGRIVDAAETLDKAPLYIVDSGNTTIVDIRAKARRLRSQHDLGLIIIDYLQLMSSHRRVESRQQEVSEISRSLKLLAKELDIPVIAVSQLNRDPEKRVDKRPQLSDLRESGALEQDSDVVMFLHREDMYSEDPAVKGVAELVVAKHRNGPVDKVKMTFLSHLTQFKDYAQAP
jgi:replicative DNA helicase